MANLAKLPFIIQFSLNLLSGFIVGAFADSRAKGVRALRSDRIASMQAIMEVLLRACCLEQDGRCCVIAGRIARPITIATIAKRAGRSRRTVVRVLGELVRYGWLDSWQIKRKSPDGIGYLVYRGLRSFTSKFWQALGLAKLFRKGVTWAKQHRKLGFEIPFKRVSAGKRKGTGGLSKAGWQGVLTNMMMNAGADNPGLRKRSRLRE